MTPDVPPILCDVPGSFPWQVFHDRHPKVVAQLKTGHPYPAGHQRALDDLLAETLTGPVRPLPAAAPDHAAWQEWGDPFLGRPWTDLPFLWAECYFHRRLLEAVSYFEPGPWYRLDPFQPLKSAELTDVDAPAEGLEALLVAAVWGNRADLGFRLQLTAAHASAAEGGLVADASADVADALRTGDRRRIAVITDNAGRELLADLLLVDHLVETGLTGEVVLHVKPHPYFVSDATVADVLACVEHLEKVGDAGPRLRQAIADGRVRLYTHWFYTAPFDFHHLPPDLAEELAAGSLTVVKGDLNYRRLVSDRHWPPTTPFADTTRYFPSPVVALRTLKSDVVVGLHGSTVSTLDASTPSWRVDGRHGLVQARL